MTRENRRVYIQDLACKILSIEQGEEKHSPADTLQVSKEAPPTRSFQVDARLHKGWKAINMCPKKPYLIPVKGLSITLMLSLWMSSSLMSLVIKTTKKYRRCMIREKRRSNLRQNFSIMLKLKIRQEMYFSSSRKLLYQDQLCKIQDFQLQPWIIE